MSEEHESRFKENLMKNHMDYLIPYGVTVFAESENMTQAQKKAFSQAQEAMSFANKVHEILLKGDWDAECIKFLSRFEKPLDAAIDAYSELQEKMGGKMPDTVDAVRHLLSKMKA